MEKTERHNQLEYDNNEEEESDTDYLESKVESNGSSNKFIS